MRSCHAADVPATEKPLIAPGVTLQDRSIAGGVRWCILQAAIHFNHPLAIILTLNQTVTEKRPGGYVVTFWTFFGLPLERALVDERGGVRTL